VPTLRRLQRALRQLQRTLRRSVLRQSELDIVIPPEISNDNFARLIRQLAAEPTVHVVLEIGSSSGAGSTAQLVAGLGEKEKADLYCLELSSARFAELSKRYRHVPWVHCYNVSSVPLAKMPTEADVEDFFTTHPDSPIQAQTGSSDG
jgi:predicted O-methyltransferase YrrM